MEIKPIKNLEAKAIALGIYTILSCGYPFLSEDPIAWKLCTISWVVNGIVLFDWLQIFAKLHGYKGAVHILGLQRNLCVATLGNAILSSASVMNVNWYVFFIIALLHSAYSYLKPKIKWQHQTKTKQNKAR